MVTWKSVALRLPSVFNSSPVAPGLAGAVVVPVVVVAVTVMVARAVVVVVLGERGCRGADHHGDRRHRQNRAA